MLPTPAEFGLSDKFSSWRQNQESAVLEIIDSQERFVGMVCPTGFGKSLTYVAAATLLGKRTLILTSTKGLQAQLLKDFGITDIRGKNNYLCARLCDGTTCDYGLCAMGLKCQNKDNGVCEYWNAVACAAVAPLVVTNYAYWMAIGVSRTNIGKFDILVCDEAHGLPNIITDWLTIKLAIGGKNISERLVLEMLRNNHSYVAWGMLEWQKWAKETSERVDEELEVVEKLATTSKYARMDYVRLKKLGEDLRSVASANIEEWMCEVSGGGKLVEFAPVWPRSYTEGTMWRGIDKIVLTSATMSRKTLDLLGILQSECKMLDYQSNFAVERRRIIHVPTVRMNHRTDDLGMRLWLSRIDQIMASRPDTKGIIHTVSYDRAKLVLERSKYKERLIGHGSRDTEQAVRRFRNEHRPVVLVSPAVMTGWDFPYSECRWQIIGKLAYPDTRNGITKKRCESDRDYGAYLAMVSMVQSCGRGMRASDDWCETFVIDDNVVWFMGKYGKEMSPRWFREAYCQSRTIPAITGMKENGR
jgi:Rad3-related DNA helicase